MAKKKKSKVEEADLAIMALKSSIERYRMLSLLQDDRIPAPEYLGRAGCALCVLYYNHACRGCPVNEYAGTLFCEGTPINPTPSEERSSLYDVVDELDEIHEYGLDKPKKEKKLHAKFRKMAKHEAEFLSNILEKKLIEREGT